MDAMPFSPERNVASESADCALAAPPRARRTAAKRVCLVFMVPR
jgi:hypothetical protein